MNTEESILAELRKITAWADMQRRVTKWALIAVAVIIPALIVLAFAMERHMEIKLEDFVSAETPDWYDVDQYVRRGDFDKAIQLGETLVLKTPQYPEAHRRLAGVYLAAGNVAEAKRHYAEAFRLFPSDENEKLLSAIEKRSKAEIGGGILDEARVLAIARAAVATNDTWIDHAEFQTPRYETNGSGWSVLVWRLPKTPGGHRIILIDGSGRVTDYIRGE